MKKKCPNHLTGLGGGSNFSTGTAFTIKPTIYLARLQRAQLYVIGASICDMDHRRTQRIKDYKVNKYRHVALFGAAKIFF